MPPEGSGGWGASVAWGTTGLEGFEGPKGQWGWGPGEGLQGPKGHGVLGLREGRKKSGLGGFRIRRPSSQGGYGTEKIVPCNGRQKINKWRGVTISLRTGGQGHPTPNYIPCPSHMHKKPSKMLIFALFDSCPRTNGPTDRRTDGRTKPLIELRVRN